MQCHKLILNNAHSMCSSTYPRIRLYQVPNMGRLLIFAPRVLFFPTIVPQSNLQTIGHGFTTVVLVLCNLIKESKVPTQLSITSPVVTLYFVCSSLPGITISIGQSRAESRSADMLTVLQYFSQSAYCRLQQEGEPLHTTEKKERPNGKGTASLSLSFSLWALSQISYSKNARPVF